MAAGRPDRRRNAVTHGPGEISQHEDESKVFVGRNNCMVRDPGERVSGSEQVAEELGTVLTSARVMEAE
jgi:hypothetical protein